tara:strand:+ start:1154 stop:1696 length:543 start_codon:yes stop_codon:yes gene_type:complete
MIETSVMAAKAILMGMLMSNGPVAQSTVDETFCMAQNIFYEARGESLKGKQAVGNVVLNRVDHKKYPDTVCGVVYEAKRYSWNNDVVIPGQCQFSWYCDGVKDDPQLFYKTNGAVIEPNMRDWRISVQVAIKMIERDTWYRDPTKGATHYYNHNISTPSWSRVYPVSIVVGNHTFLIRND